MKSLKFSFFFFCLIIALHTQALENEYDENYYSDEYAYNECPEKMHVDNTPPTPLTVNEHRSYVDDCHFAHQCCRSCGVWLPETPPIFRPFVADPRQVNYSVGWRWDDQALADRNVIDVSFGDSLAFYEWCDVWPYHGRMRIELEGALWAVFAPLKESAPLVNADYYCGLPITYAFDNWSFRLRFFHISSHVGDEFLIHYWDRNFKGKRFRRWNPSAEYLDLFASYNISEDIRIYGGLGWVVHHDESFKIGRLYAECGSELHLSELGYYDRCNNLYGMPFYGMHFRFRKDFKHHLDQTYVLGYEWGKTTGLCRIVRVFMEYHDGYSVEGQFSRYATNYFSIRASYGY